MEVKTYEKIVQTIKSNTNITREECYNILLRNLTNQLQKSENVDVALKDQNVDKSNLNLTNLQVDSKSNKPIISYPAFVSIYSNIKRRLMFKTSMWRKFKESSTEFSYKYLDIEAKESKSNKRFKTIGEKLENNILFKMAKEANVPPVLMARLVVEGFYKTNNIEYNLSNDTEIDKITVSTIIKETYLLKNTRLACEIMECCALDEDYGPVIDTIKNLSGNEFEAKLETILTEKGIHFIRENELREKGYDKTPDFKFESPVYLKNCGKTISWVDSKATFGDEISHNEYYETQYKFYLNRFGSGLVIYWLGYVKEIETCYNSLIVNDHRSVIVDDHFPDEFLTLDLDSLIQKITL